MTISPRTVIRRAKAAVAPPPAPDIAPEAPQAPEVARDGPEAARRPPEAHVATAGAADANTHLVIATAPWGWEKAKTEQEAIAVMWRLGQFREAMSSSFECATYRVDPETTIDPLTGQFTGWHELIRVFRIDRLSGELIE